MKPETLYTLAILTVGKYTKYLCTNYCIFDVSSFLHNLHGPAGYLAEEYSIGVP